MRDTLNIREHMPVIAADGMRIGTVDHMEGLDLIKLTKTDSDDGRHHFIPTDWVDHIDEQIHLNLPSSEARRLWR
jgi:hypothetical protein